MNYKTYLQHYGIKGMKWGVRRTPEQLGHKKVGYKPLKYESEVERTTKHIIKTLPAYIAASIIPGFGLAYNAYTIKTIKDSSFDGKDYTKKDGPVEKLSELRRKQINSGVEDDVKKTNPRPPGGGAGTVNNCVYCSLTMELRSRGYDVRARRKASGVATTTSFLNQYFKGAKRESLQIEDIGYESAKAKSIRAYNKLCETLEKQGPNASGVLDFNWRYSRGGHMIYYKVNESGEVNFYDGQDGKINDRSTFSLADPKGYCYTRLDNTELSENVGEVAVSRKDPVLEKKGGE